MIAELTDAATAPGVSYMHQWQAGDVVMWDNRATMHRGRPWPALEARFMVRTTISASEADGLAARPATEPGGGGIAPSGRRQWTLIGQILRLQANRPAYFGQAGSPL